MQLSVEPRRWKWSVVVAAWAIAAVLLFLHANFEKKYLAMATQLGLRGAAAPATPMKSAFPAFAADGQTWIRHALSLAEGDQVRLRYTTIDNAPKGREVHWNSAWGWTIALAGLFDRWVTGRPLPQAIEQTAIWLNPAVFLVLTVIISAWVARRGGAILAVFVALAMVGHPRVAEGFFPIYVDHHGLLTVAVFAMVLGITFMGGGWWRPEGKSGAARILPVSIQETRSAAVFAGISGALGMWVSAASVIAPIAIVGVAAIAAVVLQGRAARQSGLRFDASAWRLWGRVGSAGSFFFYLVEYFPSHLALRMESNHPFYALAWWGGAELLAEISERWLGNDGAILKGNWRRLILPVLAIAFAPATILLGGTKVFVVSDPFLSELHYKYIQEFLPLWTALKGGGWTTFLSVVGFENLALLGAVVTLGISGRRCSPLLWFATIAALLFTGMAWMQARWLLNASGSQITLALVLVGHFVENRPSLVRWTVSMAALAVMFLPCGITRITNLRDDVKSLRVTPKDAQSTVARDIAGTIRASSPQGEVVLLSSPNASTAIGYYGRFKTIGTLYWENTEGLKAAAAVLSARSEKEAAELVRKHGITHIAMISDENFVEQYYRLLHPDAKDEDIKKCFGYQLLGDRVIPTWLRMLPYKVPPDLGSLKLTVLLFKVAFEQSGADALYHVAMAKLEMGFTAEAERDFETLIKASPASYQPWMRKGELLLARHDWSGAAEAMIQGIARAPADQRPGMFAVAARDFYNRNQQAQAIQLYRAALKDRFDANIAAYLAFILATSPHDALRNGAEAQRLAEQALKADPNSPTLLNSLAAALAENGRFQEAVAVSERAIANAKVNGEAAVQRVTEERLAMYKAGKPLRK